MFSFRNAALAATVALGASAVTAEAATITYDLNTVLGNTLTSTSSFGTVTYTDGAKNEGFTTVDVNVAINDNGTINDSGRKIQEFIFNYNDAKFSSTTNFVLKGDVNTYKISENGVQADGYSAGKFDVQTPSKGNIGPQPINFNIALAGTDLTIADFEFLDTSGKLYDAVHVGNCGDTTCLPSGGTGNASIWIGSGAPSTPMPEPASFAILGAGLLGVGMMRRKKNAS